MQKLMKAAKEGTRDGLEKTKAAVKRGRCFIRTKSFISQGVRLAVPRRWPRCAASKLAGSSRTLSRPPLCLCQPPAGAL